MDNQRKMRFIIVGSWRTGSEVLVGLLDSHPKICCQMEILRPGEYSRKYRFTFHFWRRIPYPFCAYRSHVACRNTNKSHYGFKLFPYHVAHPTAAVHQFQRCGWKILYLRRQSLFDQALSQAVAMTTKRWHTRPGRETAPVAIEVGQQVFRNSLIRTDQERRASAESVQDIPHLELVYEEHLSTPSRWQATADRICAYLSIPSAPVATELAGPWRRPYAEMIVNYVQLVDLFCESGLDDSRR